MIRDRRFQAGIVAAIFCAALLWWFWPASNTPTDRAAAPERDPLTMTEQQARRSGIQLEAAIAEVSMPVGSMPATVVLPPDARAAVAVPFSGVLQRVLVVPGQTVTRGQPVAIMVSPDAIRTGAELSRAQARANVASASAARQAQLAQEGIIAPARADEARAVAREAAVSASEQARLLAVGGAGANGSITLRSSISGRIASITAQPGMALDGMTAPMMVEATDRIQIELQVPERMASQVATGQSIILPGGQRGRIVGTGASIDPTTRSIAVRAVMIGANGLVPGQSLTAIIEGGASAGVSISAAALTRSGDRDAVFVFDGRRMVLRPVIVVALTAERAFIREGLRAGDRVATSGITELRAASGE
jgi:membrane fusion protein, heavy metal efflux system